MDDGWPDVPDVLGGRPFRPEECFEFTRNFELIGAPDAACEDLIVILEINPWITELLGITTVHGADPGNAALYQKALEAVRNKRRENNE